jgi:ABC-type bacteriocin/lantibiotic exporter with double-glycine peptidase domain
MKKITISYKQQPTGNTCGPTCIYMVLNYIINKPNDLLFDVHISKSILEIAEDCGTDWVVGTPPDRMIRGFNKHNIKYVEYTHSPNPYLLLKKVIDSENIPIVRTITQGVPHWIIVNGYNNEKYNVLDPWLGQIEYTQEQLDLIWSKRQYQFFEIITDEY